MNAPLRAAQFRHVLEIARPRIVSLTASTPYEAVGLVSNRGTIYPLINQRRSAETFVVSQVFIKEGMAWLKERGEKAVAIYHSHPTQDCTPSKADILALQELAGTVYVIHGAREIGAWIWEDDELVEIVRIPDTYRVEVEDVEPAHN